LVRPELLCNPVDAGGEGIADPTAHLECYRLRESAGPARTVTASDLFGTSTLTLARARNLCVPSEKDGVASALALDHFKCYRVARGTTRFSRRPTTLADQFETKATGVLR